MMGCYLLNILRLRFSVGISQQPVLSATVLCQNGSCSQSRACLLLGVAVNPVAYFDLDARRADDGFSDGA